MVVTIYSTRFCPFCIRAKRLLDARGVEYTEIAVDLNPEKRLEMMERSGRRTVPQIWIGERHIGGCDDLMELEYSGDLDILLSSA